jgi:hypothetical protein
MQQDGLINIFGCFLNHTQPRKMGPEGGKNATGLSKYRDLFVS